MTFSFFISGCIYNNQQKNVIVTDFSKEFDTADHHLLHKDFEALSIGEPLLILIKYYIFENNLLKLMVLSLI